MHDKKTHTNKKNTPNPKFTDVKTIYIHTNVNEMNGWEPSLIRSDHRSGGGHPKRHTITNIRPEKNKVFVCLFTTSDLLIVLIYVANWSRTWLRFCNYISGTNLNTMQNNSRQHRLSACSTDSIALPSRNGNFVSDIVTASSWPVQHLINLDYAQRKAFAVNVIQGRRVP